MGVVFFTKTYNIEFVVSIVIFTEQYLTEMSDTQPDISNGMPNELTKKFIEACEAVHAFRKRRDISSFNTNDARIYMRLDQEYEESWCAWANAVPEQAPSSPPCAPQERTHTKRKKTAANRPETDTEKRMRL